MGNFRGDNRSGGRRDYGQRDFRRHSFGGGGRDRQMHKTTCSNCGKDCEVPFVPTGGKPVFCSKCFEKRSRDSDSRRFEDRVPRKLNFKSNNNRPQNNVQLEAINTKLDKILEMLASLTSPEVENLRPQSKETVVTKKKTKTSKKTASTKEEQL